MNIELIKVSVSNIIKLQAICVSAYAENFGDHWNENGLELYLESEFSQEKLTANLKNKFLEYYFINLNEECIGFIQANYQANLPEQINNEAAELKKIYMLPNYKGGGIGTSVIKQFIEIVRSKEKKILFLYVIDQNSAAIRFYEKTGFKYHSKTVLDVPFFKEEFRGMNCMCMTL